VLHAVRRTSWGVSSRCLLLSRMRLTPVSAVSGGMACRTLLKSPGSDHTFSRSGFMARVPRASSVSPRRARLARASVGSEAHGSPASESSIGWMGAEWPAAFSLEGWRLKGV
jgi:hypothetical protein